MEKSNKKKIPVLIIGNGSNILFTQNFKGIVILNKIKFLKIKESTKKWFVHVGSGYNLHNLIKTLIKNKIYGLENMALIPGSVGASPIQNIGAYGMEFKNICNYVDILDIEKEKYYRLNKSECKFKYRDSIFNKKMLKNFAIISVGIHLNKKWKLITNHNSLKPFKKQLTTPEKVFKKICNIRKEKIPNPNTIGNAGSFFKNPIISNKHVKKFNLKYNSFKKIKKKISAGWLIEACNLKGYQYNGASIYNKQSAIIINKNNASGKDILNLAKIIHAKVIKKFNISLEPEVHLIGKTKKIKWTDII